MTTFEEALAGLYAELYGFAERMQELALAEYFKNRAARALQGKPDQPAPPPAQMSKFGTSSEVQQAYDVLTSELHKGAQFRHPQAAARAQAAYDCWIAPFTSAADWTVANCRAQFYNAITIFQPSMAALRDAPPSPVASPNQGVASAPYATGPSPEPTTPSRSASGVHAAPQEKSRYLRAAPLRNGASPTGPARNGSSAPSDLAKGPLQDSIATALAGQSPSAGAADPTRVAPSESISPPLFYTLRPFSPDANITAAPLFIPHAALESPPLVTEVEIVYAPSRLWITPYPEWRRGVPVWRPPAHRHRHRHRHR